MKTTIVFLLVTLCVAGQIYACDEPGTMSIYFDENAEVNIIEAVLITIVPAYVILTDTDFATIHGYEFGYEIAGNYLFIDADLAGYNRIDLVYEPGNHIVSLPEPLPTTAATVLCTLRLVTMDHWPVYYRLTGATPNSVEGNNLPAIHLADNVIRSTDLLYWDSAANEPLICAVINRQEPNVSPVNQASWDEVKSLYR